MLKSTAKKANKVKSQKPALQRQKVQKHKLGVKRTQRRSFATQTTIANDGVAGLNIAPKLPFTEPTLTASQLALKEKYGEEFIQTAIAKARHIQATQATQEAMDQIANKYQHLLDGDASTPIPTDAPQIIQNHLHNVRQMEKIQQQEESNRKGTFKLKVALPLPEFIKAVASGALTDPTHTPAQRDQVSSNAKNFLDVLSMKSDANGAYVSDGLMKLLNIKHNFIKARNLAARTPYTIEVPSYTNAQRPFLNEPAQLPVNYDFVDTDRLQRTPYPVTRFLHPRMHNQLRWDENPATIHEVYEDMTTWKKLDKLAKRIIRSPKRQQFDEFICTDPFGVQARAIVRNAMVKHDQLFNFKFSALEGAVAGIMWSFGAVYLHDVIAAEPLHFTSMIEVFKQNQWLPFSSQVIADAADPTYSSTSGKLLWAIPGAVIGTFVPTALGTVVSPTTILPELDPTLKEMEKFDMSKMNIVERRAVSYLQHIDSLHDAGVYEKTVLDTLQRHNVILRDVLPQGDLTDVNTFNSDFLISDPIVHKADHH